MPLYIDPKGTRSVLKDIRVQAAELSSQEGKTVNVVNVACGDHNLVLMAAEVASLVSALQSMANEVGKANKAKPA